jgi:hypothetical protein
MMVAMDDLHATPVKREDLWKDLDGSDQNVLKMRMKARDQMERNHTPCGGLLKVPEAFGSILTMIQKYSKQK